MKIFYLIMLLTFLMFLQTGNRLRIEADLNETTFNQAIDSINFDKIINNLTIPNNSSNTYSTIKTRGLNVIKHLTIFIAATLIEVSKYALELGYYQGDQYNTQSIINLIIGLFYSYLIITLIIPIMLLSIGLYELIRWIIKKYNNSAMRDGDEKS